MPGHEIASAMIHRRSLLRDSDRSRFGTLRLVVQTQGLDKCVCSVIQERIGGGRVDGTRLGFAVISRVDAEGRPLPPEFLLKRALEALLKQS